MGKPTWKKVGKRGGSLGATKEREHLEWAESGGPTLGSPSWLLKETENDAQTLCPCGGQSSSMHPAHRSWIRCPRYLLKLEQGRAVGRWQQPGSLCF